MFLVQESSGRKYTPGLTAGLFESVLLVVSRIAGDI